MVPRGPPNSSAPLHRVFPDPLWSVGHRLPVVLTAGYESHPGYDIAHSRRGLEAHPGSPNGDSEKLPFRALLGFIVLRRASSGKTLAAQLLSRLRISVDFFSVPT